MKNEAPQANECRIAARHFTSLWGLFIVCWICVHILQLLHYRWPSSVSIPCRRSIKPRRSAIPSVAEFLPRDASAERGDATVSRLSVCLSVTFRYRVQIHWNSSKITSRPNSLRPVCWLTPNIGDLVQREHPQNWG